jgi:hypothetical protein
MSATFSSPQCSGLGVGWAPAGVTVSVIGVPELDGVSSLLKVPPQMGPEAEEETEEDASTLTVYVAGVRGSAGLLA